jgi:CRISPR-associated protein Csx10
MVTDFTLTLQLCAPLALHQTRTGVQYVETHDYIPGTALRGALAETYLAQHGQPDDLFHALFLSDQVQYGDLWPIIEGKSTTLIPATAQACKRDRLKHATSFRDTLLDALSSQYTDVKCKECNEPLDRMSGYLCDMKNVQSLSPRSRLRVSTAIERGTGTVAREMLFTQHTLIGKRQIDEKSTSNKTEVLFQGSIRLSDPTLQNELAPFLQHDTQMFLGAGRSRGLGHVRIKAWQATTTSDPLEERWRKFNTVASRAGDNPCTRYFSLTLLSHLALRDNLLRPVLGEITPQHFGLLPQVIWVHYPGAVQPVVYLSTITVAGWNVATGLPKTDTVALARGSVLLGQCEAAQEPAVLARLAEIEAQGVGERRGEGFGRVAVCYPIHYERWEVK